MKKNYTLALLLIPFSIIAQEFHVFTNGDDGALGTIDQPWESIQHAMDNATPGSTVFIHEGAYNERVYVNVSGENSAYITFKAFELDQVILDGAGLTDNALIEIYNVHHITIEGLKIRNNEQADAIGIIIDGACDHIRIKSCDISNINFSTNPDAEITSETNAQALIVYGSEADHVITDLEIIDNEIFNCRLGYSEALAINGNVDGFIVSENKIHDVTNIGIDIIGHEGTCSDPDLDQARNGTIADNETYNCLSPYATSAGIYVDGGKRLFIERNLVYNNQWGIEIGCENQGKSTEDIIVRNNFIYGNSTAGIACGGYDYPNSGKVVNALISNNSLFGNDTEDDFSGELFLSYVEDLACVNNIFYSRNSTGVLMSDENLATPSTQILMQNNLWYHPFDEGDNIEFNFEGNYYNTLAEFTSGTGFGVNSIFDMPDYQSTSGSIDLHINSGSPAIDAGTSIGIDPSQVDIDGEVRFFGQTIDMGADEFGSSVGIREFSSIQTIIYPNPTSDYIMIASSEGKPKTFAILDFHGKKLLSGNLINRQISLAELKKGTYLLSLFFETGSTTVARIEIE